MASVEDSLMTKKDVWNVPPVAPDKARKRMSTEVAPLRKQRRTLNAKEWKFVTELVSGDGRVTMKEAAIRAGYKPSSASVMAWKLTNPEINPHVVAGIQAYRGELNSKYNTSYERHMRDLQTLGMHCPLLQGVMYSWLTSSLRLQHLAAIGCADPDKALACLPPALLGALLNQLSVLLGSAPVSTGL